MNKDSVIDYSSCILFRVLGFFIRNLPKKFSLFLGRRIGDLLYALDSKHKAIAYVNIKTALSDQLTPDKISGIAREFYRSFGQNLIEIFFIPLINKEYINKYITIEGLDYIAEAFKKGKGVILLGVHEGSWELSNIICASLGFPFVLFVRDQRYPRLDKLLNSYRIQKGCRIIQRGNGVRQLIQALKTNQAIGMTADQGGKNGTLVKFFGKEASMPTGAVRFGLKYGVAIIPAFYTRLKGPYIKIIINPAYELKKTGDPSKDIAVNLQGLVSIFEEHILKYPQEYLWSYKIWKHSREKNILILSDDKTGHLRQAQALSKIISEYLKEKGAGVRIDNVEVYFKSKFAQSALTFSSCLADRFHCQGCLWCLRNFLTENTYKTLISKKPDVIISCGSSLAPVNFILARENLAKSIVIMRPSILSVKRFDLVVIPRHDSPIKRRNVVVTEGALNLIDESYLKERARKLRQSVLSARGELTDICFGLLLGGDTKGFSLGIETVSGVIRQIKSACEKLKADILVTTSRRTSPDIENLVKEEFSNYPRCKLLIVANEKNIPEAVGGILGLSQIIITSPESISMISEAVNSNRYVLVFKSGGLNSRHSRFLEHFAKNRYVYLSEVEDLSRTIGETWTKRPQIYTSKDNLLIRQSLKRIL